jgi:hypothetical protein
MLEIAETNPIGNIAFLEKKYALLLVLHVTLLVVFGFILSNILNSSNVQPLYYYERDIRYHNESLYIRQGRLNNIIGRREKQCTGVPSYTTTYRNKNVNVD